MSIRERLAALDDNALRWLGSLADPCPTSVPPAPALHAAAVAALLEAATFHGVLPSVLRRLKAASEWAGSATPEVVTAAERQLIALAAHSLRLLHHGRRVLGALADAGVPAAIVKGPVFAERLYPDPALRPFSDIDILVTAKALPDTRRILTGLGFRKIEQPERSGLDYHEDQWVPDGTPNVLVEIQDNLVHSPSLSPRTRLELSDLVELGAGDAGEATALLLTAAVHGAVGHQFERLRFAVDLCQAARGAREPVDVPRLAEIAARTQTLLPLVAGLDLAGRLFREPAAIELANQLDRSWGRAVCRSLWTPMMVLRAQGPARGSGTWRRKAVREIFKRASA